MIGTCSMAVLKARSRRREAVTPELSSGPGPPPAAPPRSRGRRCPAHRQTRVCTSRGPLSMDPTCVPLSGTPRRFSEACPGGCMCPWLCFSLPTSVPPDGWTTVCLFSHVMGGLRVSRLELLRRHLHSGLYKDLYFCFFFLMYFIETVD